MILSSRSAADGPTDHLLAEVREWYTGWPEPVLAATTVDLLDSLAGIVAYWSAWYADEIGPVPDRYVALTADFGDTHFRGAVYSIHAAMPDAEGDGEDPFYAMARHAAEVLYRLIRLRGDALAVLNTEAEEAVR